LLLEFLPQLFKRKVLEILQICLIRERADHGNTVSFFEVAFEELSDAVLLGNVVSDAVLLVKGFLEVFSGCDFFSFFVLELEGKVSDNPHEGWEILGKIFRFDVFYVGLLLFEVNVLCYLKHKTHILQGSLVNRPLRIINEER